MSLSVDTLFAPPVAGGAPEYRGAGGSPSPKEKLAGLESERDQLKQEARTLAAKYREKRELTPEEDARVTAIETRLGQIEAELQAMKTAMAQEPMDDAGKNGASKAGQQSRGLGDRLAALEQRFAAEENANLERRLLALERVANGNPIDTRGTPPVPVRPTAPNYTEDLDDRKAEQMHSDAFRAWCGATVSGAVTRNGYEAAQRLGVDLYSNDLRVRIDPTWVRSGQRDRDVRNDRRKIEQRNAIENRAVLTVANTGAYLVPTILMDKFIEKMVAFNKLRDHCSVFQTADGNAMTYPTFDDTANTGSTVTTEDTDRAQTDIVAGQGTFSSSEFNSDIALFSHKLLRDSTFDVESLAGAMLGRRIGRRQSTLYTTGTGSGQPQGVVTGASAGATAAGASAIAYGDIVNLMMSLDDAYDANAKFAFNKASVLAALLKLAESTGKPLFGNLVDGVPRTLLGKEIILLYGMANIGTTNVSMLYGDFEEAVMIREVGELIISRSTEYKWVKRQIALTADWAGDCRVVQSAALKKLTHP
jgi:HK97 family phage major capsid protein